MPIDITDQDRRAQYVINGLGPYSFDFEVLETTDVAVYRDAALLAMTADYTVNVNDDGTGSITLLSATGTTLTILGARPYARRTDFATGGDFFADTVNDEYDSIQIQILQLVETINRSIKFPPYDTSGSGAELPDVSARAGRYLGFSAVTGQMVALPGTSVPSQSAALVSYESALAGSVARNLRDYLDEDPSASIFDFATGATAALNVGYLRTAITTSAGKRLRLPAGDFSLDSATLAAVGLVIPTAGIHIQGAGEELTKLTITGVTSCHLFHGTNLANFTVSDMTLRGNSQASTFGIGNAAHLYQDDLATVDGIGFHFENVRFENFKGDYWVDVYNASTQYKMKMFRIRNCAFISESGNARGPANIGMPSAALSFLGTDPVGADVTSATWSGGVVTVTQTDHGFESNDWVLLKGFTPEAYNGDHRVTVTGGSTYTFPLRVDPGATSVVGQAAKVSIIEDISIEDCTLDGEHIKSLVAFWIGSRRGRMSNFTINGAGSSSAFADDSGAYGVMVYGGFNGYNTPSDFEFSSGVIKNPRSCGYYLAGANNVRINEGSVSGQTDSQDASIPKAAIALNGSSNVQINGVDLAENLTAIMATTGCNDFVIGAGTRIESNVASAVGVKLQGGIKRASIDIASINLTGASNIGVSVQASTGAGNVIEQLSVNVDQMVAASGFRHFSNDSAPYNTNDLTVRLGQANCSTMHITANNIANAVTIHTSRLYGNPSSHGVDITGSTKVRVRDNVFDGFAAVSALFTADAQGEIWNNAFVNSSAAHVSVTGSEDLGRDAPTWTGVHGTRVQDCNAVEAGSAASKYVRQGWYHDGTAWCEQRMLTGN